jgi:hypothetical protein
VGETNGETRSESANKCSATHGQVRVQYLRHRYRIDIILY